MGRLALSTWLPDRTPTWTDVCLALFVLFWVPLNVGSFGRYSWPWVAIGFSCCLIALGLGANSALGTRIDRWSEEIGIAGRALVIVLFALGVWIAKASFDIQSMVYASVGSGMMLAATVFVLLHVPYAGEIDGWRST